MPKHPYCCECNRPLWASSDYKFEYEGKTYWSLLHKGCHTGLTFGVECMERQLNDDDYIIPSKRESMEKAVAKFKWILRQSTLPPGDPPYSKHPTYEDTKV
jgi:hypothetical protein